VPAPATESANVNARKSAELLRMSIIPMGEH
jgi:hypothetical protein